MNVNGLVLGSAGAGIAALGASYLVDPNLVLNVYGFSIQSASEANLFRAACGGMFVGFALLFCAGALKAQLARTAQFALLAFMGGLAIGRLVSMATDGVPHVVLVVALAVEVTYSGAAFYLLQNGSVRT